MIDALLGWLRGGPHVPLAHDPLRELIERAHDSQREAWDAVNQRRRERGECPLRPPSWEGLMGLPDEGCDGEAQS
jgi:hypothetical protein